MENNKQMNAYKYRMNYILVASMDWIFYGDSTLYGVIDLVTSLTYCVLIYLASTFLNKMCERERAIHV